ncbi:MAG: alpha/beta hydrolase [Candidatus Heimdallarchaeota archaeon]|nr:MAG: alpha/beta hydrolase [Candidatus Heimdallarchaeota archaeon]
MFGVLFLHSFGSTNLEFKEFEEYLQEQGFRTNSPLLPGHGTFPKDLQKYTFKDWLRASEQALMDLNCQVNFLVGQITGAPLALFLAASHPELLGIVTLSGIINLPKWHTLINTFLRSKSRMVSWGSPSSKLLPFYNQSIREKIKLYKEVPQTALNETFRLIQETRKLLKKVNQPIYIFHSSARKDFNIENAHYLFKNVSSKKRKLMIVEKGSPLMSVDVARHMVFRESMNFFWSCIDLYQM